MYLCLDNVPSGTGLLGEFFGSLHSFGWGLRYDTALNLNTKTVQYFLSLIFV
jgi:hypothetical protein